MPPHKDIYLLTGRIRDEASDRQGELDLKQFVPRGASIENSENVYALVAYTGKETKLYLN